MVERGGMGGREEVERRTGIIGNVTVVRNIVQKS